MNTLVSSVTSAMPGMDYANAGIILENMVLAATDLGIDSCIMGAPTAVISQMMSF
jgi:nitroreductase